MARKPSMRPSIGSVDEFESAKSRPRKAKANSKLEALINTQPKKSKLRSNAVALAHKTIGQALTFSGSGVIVNHKAYLAGLEAIVYLLEK